LCSKLLEKGVDPLHRNKKGLTPLLTAVTSGSYGIIEILLKTDGGGANVATPQGDTCMHIAAK